MVDEVFYDLGVDIDSKWCFVDGDLKLISYNDNMVQALTNRLNTNLNELDLFYEEYGSVFTQFLGWRGNDETICFIRTELETVLRQEPRLRNWEYNIEYTGNGILRVDLKLYPTLGSEINVELELTEEGTVEVVE